MDPSYFNQAHYQNMPTHEGKMYTFFKNFNTNILVNWAQLAQRWIASQRAEAPQNFQPGKIF